MPGTPLPLSLSYLGILVYCVWLLVLKLGTPCRLSLVMCTRSINSYPFWPKSNWLSLLNPKHLDFILALACFNSKR
jgi:hypothetical protein